MSTSDGLIAAARTMIAGLGKLRFAPPVAYVYNPLAYAWQPYEAYLRRFGSHPKRVLFLGMNPGPFGMVQTGIPFGQVAAVRDWLDLNGLVKRPPNEHPKRPVLGFVCPRSEISGERLWGLFRKRFGTPGKFFREHLVMNYCPLAFLEESGRNRTPDKLAPEERSRLYAICDEHLREISRLLEPEWVVAVGDFAARRARESLVDQRGIKVGRILHPSPACPASNKDWAGTVTAQLTQMGLWKRGS